MVWNADYPSKGSLGGVPQPPSFPLLLPDGIVLCQVRACVLGQASTQSLNPFRGSKLDTRQESRQNSRPPRLALALANPRRQQYRWLSRRASHLDTQVRITWNTAHQVHWAALIEFLQTPQYV